MTSVAIPAFRLAGAQDWEQMRDLLLAAALPLDGARECLANFLLAVEGDRLVGCGALEFHADAALLRSLAVDVATRGYGVAGQLVERLLALAAERGVYSVSLLTTTAETFFPRFGFEAVPRDVLPRALQSSAEFRGACPDSAIAMIRRIVAHQTNR